MRVVDREVDAREHASASKHSSILMNAQDQGMPTTAAAMVVRRSRTCNGTGSHVHC